MLGSHADSGANAKCSLALSGAAATCARCATTRIIRIRKVLLRSPVQRPCFLFLNLTLSYLLLRTVPSAMELDIAAILGYSLRQGPTGQTTQQPPFEKGTFENSEPPPNATADNNDGSGCCSGIFDCSALTE